jgi:hypothetical protein
VWFWLSHEEKCPCLELSMGGQPWPELELHSQPWGSSPEREGEGEGERGGGVGGAAVRPARVLLLHAVRERKTGRRREEKREKRKEEGKERKEKEKNGNIF